MRKAIWVTLRAANGTAGGMLGPWPEIPMRLLLPSAADGTALTMLTESITYDISGFVGNEQSLR
jgi:hypothetical protein